MFRDFLYLDEEKLNSYVSQVEDGLRMSRSRTEGESRGHGGAIDAKLVKGSRDSSVQSESASQFSDTPEAKFQRFITLVEGDPEAVRYRTVFQEADAEALQAGDFVDITASIYESDFTKTVGASGLMQLMPLLQKAGSSMGNTQLDNIPKEQLDMMSVLGSLVGESRVIVGELEDSDWQFMAELKKTIAGDPEGDFRIVGKVRKAWREGHRPLPAIPAISKLPRDQRREWERKGPSGDADPMWLKGPAIELDVLAIWS